MCTGTRLAQKQPEAMVAAAEHVQTVEGASGTEAKALVGVQTAGTEQKMTGGHQGVGRAGVAGAEAKEGPRHASVAQG